MKIIIYLSWKCSVAKGPDAVGTLSEEKKNLDALLTQCHVITLLRHQK